MWRALGAVGEVEIATVFEQVMSMSAREWFPSFRREDLAPHENWLAPAHYDPDTELFAMPVQSFVLKSGRRFILIDTCCGNDKHRDGIESVHMLRTPYLERLGNLGLTPEDISLVMCTHLHVDHIGWNTRLIDGRWVPTFPNARYVMARSEFEAAKDEAARPDTLGFIRNCFRDSVLPVVESGKELFVRHGDTLLDLFSFVDAPGHSPGNMRIELNSQGEEAIFAGDIVHSPMQIPLWEWSSAVCWDQGLSATTRRALLEDCVQRNALLIPAHFSAPHVCRIRRHEGTFRPEFGW